MFTVELKRGYSKRTFADLLDAPPRAAVQTYEKWFEQAAAASGNAKSWAWMLVVKRDKRDPILFMPYGAQLRIRLLGISNLAKAPHVTLSRPSGQLVCGCPLRMLWEVTPALLEQLMAYCDLRKDGETDDGRNPKKRRLGVRGASGGTVHVRGKDRNP
jgi:hypothetical protein